MACHSCVIGEPLQRGMNYEQDLFEILQFAR